MHYVRENQKCYFLISNLNSSDLRAWILMKITVVVDKIQKLADPVFKYSYLVQFLFKITKCSVTCITQFRYVHYRVNLYLTYLTYGGFLRELTMDLHTSLFSIRVASS